MLDSRPASIAAQSSIPDAPPKSGWFRWFTNSSIGRKQLLALLVCELIPILGFGIGSMIMTMNSLRTQLLAQAKSEIAVTETNYNTKVNQMGFGSRGQSDNAAIISAAKAFQRNDNLANDSQTQVQQTLQNEVKARKMEYATLVGKNLRIIANANAKRTKEAIANPALIGLIQQTLKDGRQVKATEIVDAEELSRENPPLPNNFSKQDALIRYVVTPVRDSDSQEVIGALVFGDIVNRKPSIIENTLSALGGGYSAIYMRQANGEFKLAAALDKNVADARQAQPDVALSDTAIVKAAFDAKGDPVTQRVKVGEQTYTVAAKAVPQRIVETPDGPVAVIGEPNAILVRGTPENLLNQLLINNLQQEAIVLVLALAAIAVWSALFRRLVLKPIQALQQTTEAFTEGDRTVRAPVFAQDEVGQLAIAFNRMAESVNSSETALADEVTRQEQQTRDARALSDITVRLRRSLDTQKILQAAISEIRNFLRVDRTIVYLFDRNSLNGTVIAESIKQDDLSVMGRTIRDPLGLERLEYYNRQPAWNSDDQPSDRHRQTLIDLGTQSEIVAPLKQNERVTGLVFAQTCDRSRTWKESEITFFTQLVAQIGYALDQADLLKERQAALQASETRKDDLQQQVIQLLSEVQNASAGDLTVHANVTSGDIGTVADFFNAIVENLRDIVLKVKQSANQVNKLLDQNAGEVQHLAAQAQQQAEETTRTLDSIEQMTEAMQTVADRARHAAMIAETATNAAQSGETVMDNTVTSIYSLRATIEDATRKVKQLGESSQQIGRIVSLINDLAVQTDLLAINASLEASRAGDQGRGFGIVATEIGELASRSATATREITAMIETVQQQTIEVVEAMNRGATQVVEGAHLARNAKQSLIHVVQVSQQMDSLVNSISDAMLTQTETSRSITDLIKEVAEVSMLTSDSSRRVTTALRQTVGVAEELQASVSVFKVQEGDRS